MLHVVRSGQMRGQCRSIRSGNWLFREARAIAAYDELVPRLVAKSRRLEGPRYQVLEQANGRTASYDSFGSEASSGRGTIR